MYTEVLKNLENELNTILNKPKKQIRGNSAIGVQLPSNLSKPVVLNSKFQIPDVPVSTSYKSHVLRDTSFFKDVKIPKENQPIELFAPMIIRDRPKFEQHEGLSRLVKQVIPSFEPPQPPKQTLQVFDEAKIRREIEDRQNKVKKLNEKSPFKPAQAPISEEPSQDIAIEDLGHFTSNEDAGESRDPSKKTVKWKEGLEEKQNESESENSQSHTSSEDYDQSGPAVQTSDEELAQEDSTSPLAAKYSSRSEDVESELSQNQFSLSNLQKEAEHSVDELERLVQKQHQFLLSSGYISASSQDSHSMSASHHRTFDELEKEINSIKDLLTEKENEYNKLSVRESELDKKMRENELETIRTSDEEEEDDDDEEDAGLDSPLSSSYAYSSDEKESEDTNLSPRFQSPI